ncbi:ABC transporter permease [Megalodesulfovibrio gigas]|uniref:Putative binding-protein-dependent transport system inner membrane protein n=1 Tax=Megalodesulfovibrio gigas (strain ATCC 19364 / DSM 1382 / NCIMB 9332 / VKM B-1759) TaxID=1121448 RepID=T2GAZ5_MEGG1|nr:ABC transporter permease [Megalodesulfovibrio gigas]AGW13301.1 putative binding-protein-dependent transport system inner membrane protein [Megalodesulfovibrio gigas DSM 1382 = ATCC 19364]
MPAAWGRFADSHLMYSFRRDTVAKASLGILLVLLVSSFACPWIAPTNPYDPASLDLMMAQTPPAWMEGGAPDQLPAFVLGADDQGRDLLSTMLYGMRVSLVIGLGAVLVQAVLGIAIGLTAGYLGNRVEILLMRLADVQLSFSTLLVAIFIGAMFRTAFGVASYERLAVPILICIIGLAEWPQYARTVRASVLAEKKKEYVEAARVVGLPTWRIMLRHILPNTLSPVLVISTVQVANAMMTEAGLSFLGFGMPVTQPSLGSLINAGFEYLLSGSWWITIFPGSLLVVLILSINLLGDFCRDVMNPRLYKGM